MGHSSSYFRQMLGLGYNTDYEIMNSIVNKHCISWWWFYNDVGWVHMAWLWPLVCQNTSLTNLFVTIYSHSWIPYTPTVMGNSKRVMHHVIRPKLTKIGLRSILETSNEWCGYNICLTNFTEPLWDMIERRLFTCKTICLKILENCGYLTGLDITQRSSDLIWN